MRDNHDNDDKFEDNVISLFGDDTTDVSDDSLEEETSIPSDEESADESLLLESSVTGPVDSTPKAKSFLSASLFLKTKNQQLLPKVINEIHAMSGRYACLPFEQMASQLESVEDIWSLGQITIVLSDVLSITPAKRSLIASYLKRSQSLSDLGPELNEIPLFLISANSSLESLIESNILDVSFVEQIETCVLEVDRLPMRPMMMKFALELFLEPGAIL